MADGSSGTDIEKHTILKLSDPNTGAASSGDGDLFLGILLEENIGGDGTVRYAVSRHGVWDIKNKASTTISAGNRVNIQGANLIGVANVTTAADFDDFLGVALQDAAADEVLEALVGG